MTPLKKEKDIIIDLLNQNKPIHVFKYIMQLLKGEKKDDPNLKLLAISYLNYIASECFLVGGDTLNFRKSLGKSEKLIRELKLYGSDEMTEMLLNFEASLNQSKFKFKLSEGKNYSDLVKKYLQLSISNYWRSLRISNISDEKYNTRNNLANCLVLAGRFIEAIALFDQNIIENPKRFQSIVSWGHAMENLGDAAQFEDIPSFYFVLGERYIDAMELAPNSHLKQSIENNIESCRRSLLKLGFKLSQENIDLNRLEEQEEFIQFSKYRKYVLKNGLALNEHSLHCHCKNAEFDDLNIGLYTGSIHRSNDKKLKELERYLNRIKSEFAFARLLFYKYEVFNEKNTAPYDEGDYKNLAPIKDTEILGYRIEHIRTSYRLLYGILDKIASAILTTYDIAENGKNVYFEDVFYQFDKELKEKRNIHLYALKSMSLDLSQSLDGNKVGSLGFYKKIRNRLEHGLLVLTNEPSDMQNNEINNEDFRYFIFELMRLTRSAIFSLNFMIRSETLVEEI